MSLGRFHVVEDLDWPFDGSAQFEIRMPEMWASSIKVDPFPCYAHSLPLVTEVAARVEALFPVERPPHWYLPAFESVHRTNGWADRSWGYRGEKNEERFWMGYIVLSGKRIPIHPAMTRYLVSHEYGHIVQWQIEQKRGIKEASVTDFDREYADKVRPGAECAKYGGRQWHMNVGELIANDFRICVTGFEPEFWPHPQFSHPLETPAVQEFWSAITKECAYAKEQAA